MLNRNKTVSIALTLVLVFGFATMALAAKGKLNPVPVVDVPDPVGADLGGCKIFRYDAGFINYVWQLPDEFGDTAFGVIFSPEPYGCTLKTVRLYSYGSLQVGAPTLKVEIWNVDGNGFPTGVALASLTQVPPASNGFRNFNFAPFNLVLTNDYAVVATELNGGSLGDTLVLASDAGQNATHRTIEDYLGNWEYVVDGWGLDFQMLWRDTMCCLFPPIVPCFPTSDLDWATRSNNFGRTNATSAAISDLCAVTRAWSANVDPAPGVNPIVGVNFTSPVIADGKVLVSTFNTLNCYNQATGALLWTFGGFPYVGDDLRCNVTVEGDSAVYVGGASFRAFSKVRLSNGTVIWSRNAGGSDTALGTGFTRFAPSVLDGGAVVTIDEAGAVWKLNPATGLNLAPPILLPDAPNAIPLDGLTGNGAGKIWVTTANGGTLADGNIHQIDVASWTIDWTLEDPSSTFNGGDTTYDFEGFPAPLAYESGILYYHSRVRDDAGSNTEYPDHVGAVGAIDAATEDGTGAGILWVAPYPAGGVLYSGVTLGDAFLYTGHQGIWSGTVEAHGVAAYDKVIGAQVWTYGFFGSITEGENESGTVVNNLRVGLPITLVCGTDGVPYLFVGDDGGAGATVASGGDWRLLNGNNGAEVWRRKFSGRVSGTAVVDGFLAVATNANQNGTTGGGGSLIGFTVGAARPRLQVDSEQVFRTATPGDGLSAVNMLTDAISNTGCANLNIAGYTVVDVAPAGPGPARAIISDVNPVLSATAQRAANAMATGGYEAMLLALTEKQIATFNVKPGLAGDDVVESNARTFAENVNTAASTIFLSGIVGPALVGAGATGTLNFQYDETGLSNNTMYINYILIDSDDPDFYPQDPTGAIFGDPYVQVTLFIGCPDDAGDLTLGEGTQTVTNYGETSDGAGSGLNLSGEANHFDGGLAMVWGDSTQWAFDGVSLSSGDAKEWGPTLPCGINIGSGSYSNPIGGLDAVDTVSYNMIDLASSQGFFTTGSRQMGGVFLTIQQVGSHDAAFGDFGLAKVVIMNEADGNGPMTNIYFGTGQDWDVDPFGANNGRVYADGYAMSNGGLGGPAASTMACGDARLDGPAVGTAILGSGGYSGSFMMADFFGYSGSNHPTGTGPHAYELMSTPNTYVATNYPGEVGALANVDLGAYSSLAYFPALAEGASVELYFCTYQIKDGVNGRTWTTLGEFDAAYTDIVCKAKAFAGFGKGDLNCDGCADLADVVLLGNIVDGISVASGAAIYTADADGDNDIDNDDYDLLYDVISGVGGSLANAWRF